jgi:hypothetical protein
MTDRDLTVAAVAAHGWEVVRLVPRGKKPAGSTWDITNSADTVARWFKDGANVGLICHERTGVAVLDPDNSLAWADMVDALGQPCPASVITGSGRLHYYFRWASDLPAKIVWKGEIIGEIQRGPGRQQVVMPGSVHPRGGTYRWITETLGGMVEPINPLASLPELAGDWLAFFRHEAYLRVRLRGLEQRG